VFRREAKEEYTGEWKNNFMDGFGTKVFSDNQTYTGQWKLGQMCGAS
jgi:hypothetical protein